MTEITEPIVYQITHLGRRYLQFVPVPLGDSAGDQLADFRNDYCGNTAVAKERGQEPCENLVYELCRGMEETSGTAYVREPSQALTGICARCIRNRTPFRQFVNSNAVNS
jgi:hypothetical protein